MSSQGGYPYSSADNPHPAGSSARDTLTLSAGDPHPARAFAGGYPYALCRQPPPRPRLRGWISIRFCRHPHPTRAFGAPPPPPPRGRGQCVAISGEQPYPGWSRWTTVPGFSPGSLHVLDRGDIAIGGGGSRGGGTRSPSPVSHAPAILLRRHPPPLSLTLQPSYFSPAPLARASCRLSIRSLPAPPTPPAPSALLPRPRRGGGVRAWRYQGSSRIRGGAGGKPYPALFRDLPMHWTVEISPRGEGLTGRGNLFPLPCL